MNKRIKPTNLPLTARQLYALIQLLSDGMTDTGSNEKAALYAQMLRKADVRTLFVRQPPVTPVVPKIVKPDPDEKNADRARWAEAALICFQIETGTDDEDALADLLCDLMHWCDREGYAFKEALRRAKSHYGEETTDPEVANA
jgi:hypothetical protein